MRESETPASREPAATAAPGDVPASAMNLEAVLDDLFTYHSPTLEQAQKYDTIAQAARGFARTVIETCPDCPDRTAAIRHIRDARMTANASIATKTGGLMPRKPSDPLPPSPRERAELRRLQALADLAELEVQRLRGDGAPSQPPAPNPAFRHDQ